MTEHTDDAEIAELLAPLAQLEPVPFTATTPSGSRSLRNPVLVGAAVAVGLAVAGVAIAASFGAFSRISAAYGPQTPAALRWAKTFQARCDEKLERSSGIYFPQCHLVLSSARLLSAQGNIYIVADTHGDLCNSVAGGTGCGPPLTATRPITLVASNTGPIPPGGTLTIGGIALDGVESVSFRIWNDHVTVRVLHNVWQYTRHRSSATGPRCVVVHMDDGSTLTPFPEVPCP